jgi:RND family efflux transporter MFP subunit
MRYKIIKILFIICGLVYSNLAQSEEAVLVKAVKVEMADLYDVFSVIGQCKNDNSRDYYANISGRIDFISPKQGGAVNKNDIILIIDQDIAAAIKSQSIAALKNAENSYKRDKALFDRKYISDNELEKSANNFESAKLAYVKAMNNYDNQYIIAPFDGEIGVIKTKMNDEVKQGDYLFTIIARNSNKNIFIELPETFYNKISQSTEILIDDNKLGKSKGKITAISQYLSDNGTINARIALNSDSNLIHGSYVNINLIINKHRNLTVPDQALQTNNSGNFVYIIKDNIIKQVYVKLGTSLNGLQEVISDKITEKDMVVLSGFTKIADGSAVKLLD